MKDFFTVLPALLVILYAVMGYRLIKIKKLDPWWNMLLIISATPLFWFIVGAWKSPEPSPKTKLWSNSALLWGFANLVMILSLKNLL